MSRVGHRRISLRNSAAYTTTFTGNAYTTPYHSKMIVTIRATALSATPSVTVKIQGWDTDGSGDWVDLLTDAAVTDANPTVSQLKLYAGAITAANAALDLPAPKKWRVIATHGDADSLTYELFVDLWP